MQKLHFSIEIKSPAQTVYETMLGLKNKTSYESWTAVFNPTSSYEGNWEKGSKMYFTGIGENGKKGGMISQIMEHLPANFVSIRHYGFLDGDTELTTGEYVEKWAGSHENYRFAEADGITTLKVEMDAVDEFVEYFNTNYPNALAKLKADLEG